MTVAVVGAGITGLSAAYFLERLSPTPERILLIEKAKTVGGLIETFRWENFLLEKGPEALISYKKSGIQLCKDLGLEPSLFESNPENNRTFMVKNGKLFPLPYGILSPLRQPKLRLAATFAFTPLLSLKAKIRMALELLVPPKDTPGDESIRHFVSRRMGKDFFETLVEPLLSGVYGKNPGDLSAGMVLKELVSAEERYGGITKALLHSKALTGPRKSIFVSLKEGLGQLTRRLAESLTSTKIFLNCEVTAIQKNGQGWHLMGSDGLNENVDAIVMACPAFAASRLIQPFDEVLAGHLGGIEYSSATIFTYAFNREDVGHALNGYGFLIPPEENIPIHACTWTSSKWDHRAPPGKVIIRAYAPMLVTDEATQQIILNYLRSLLSIKNGPLFEEVYPLPYSMPFYRVGHSERLLKIKKNLSNHPGLFLAGAAYEGVGISDCIDSARRASEETQKYLH